MPRKAKPRITRPSGIQVSANGKYFYWKCNVSGLETFADEKRFKEVVEKYGDEKTLFKTYVLRPVKKYLDRGFDAEHIKNLIAANDGKLPSIDGNMKERKKALKKPRKAGLKKFAVGEVGVQKMTESGSVEEVKEKIYPWTGNPDYFKGSVSAINVEEETYHTCFYPNRNLDDDCYGCPIYAMCHCPSKCGEEVWKSPKKRHEVKVTPINVADDSIENS